MHVKVVVPEHVWVIAHRVHAPPQFSGLLRGMHCVPHRSVPVGHAHVAGFVVPQNWEAKQAVPQAPQLASSPAPLGFTQNPLQLVSPASQLAEHKELLQSAHAMPQPPQFCGLFVVSTHTPAQLVLPAGHAQTPALQTCVAPQAVAQLPQWSRSTKGS